MITPKRSEHATSGNRTEKEIHPLRQWPWRNKHIENTLKNPNFTFCRTDINLIVEKDAVDYISEIMKHPLKKLSNELKHLSVRFLRTSKAEVQTALRLIFHDNLSHLALASGVHAFSLFLMSMDKYKFSKSVRCLLSFSVGHFFRWLVDHNISKRVTDCSVVYLAAAFQCLTEELLTRTIQTKVTSDSSKGKQKAGKEVPTTQVYQYYNILDWDTSWCPPCLNRDSGPSTSGWVAGAKAPPDDIIHNMDPAFVRTLVGCEEAVLCLKG
ncbi:ankyrin repeat and BTB/POZ domain-containing protein 3-B-like [Bolinopsis microptera]|uniref:ankyrin repeat and BTB/POZ domain-containing protein 3-B-like n=1 Tax=Bolinopsis microptera TaxID=2820187 RepID=UPI003079B2BC